MDGAGNIYIADYWCHSVRRVDAGTGIIARFAGSGIAGFSGSGGPATLANLQWPSDVAIGTNGTVYIADRHAVWQVNPLTGTITTIPSLNFVISLGALVSIAVDATDSLFLAANDTVARMDSSTAVVTSALAVPAGSITGIAVFGGRIYVTAFYSGLLTVDWPTGRLARVVPSGCPSVWRRRSGPRRNCLHSMGHWLHAGRDRCRLTVR